jgi:hypothetical protein
MIARILYGCTVAISAMLIGCIDANADVDVNEDNDTITCSTADMPCDSQLVDSPKPHDACTGTSTTNLLVGTCWWERCVDGEKTLVTKIAGVNCVFKPDSAPNDEFVIGTCDDVGVCGKH